MSAAHNALRIKLTQYLQKYNIVTFNDSDQTYYWRFLATDHKLQDDKFSRFLDGIVGMWVQDGITDLTDFQTMRGMSLDEVVAMIRDLAWQDLGPGIEVK